MNRAYVESLLVGVALPATKRQLIEYAAAQPDGGAVAARLQVIPDVEYRALQDVGEALEPRQPARFQSAPLPHEESDLPPGGPAYLGDDVEPAPIAAAGGEG